MPKSTGKIVRIDALTEQGLTITLDSGVAVSVSANPKSLHLYFSNISFCNDALRVEQLPEGSLSNFLDIQYKPFGEVEG